MAAPANMRWRHDQPPSGHLATQCRRCFCSQSLDDTKFLARHPNKASREPHQALEIKAKGTRCTSNTSTTLPEKEHEFLDRGPHQLQS
uniref:Putative tick transposon n=1 Tax=Ixodes ricinus TaxID=34613 RepID=A0A6B0UAI9_IXORI